MPLQGSLSIERMCQLAGVSRAGFYRSLQERAPVEEDMEVRSVMQQIAVEHRRRYGYRRISAELRRRGMLVNHKRVLRIMREDNLLGVQPRAFVVTTDSDHELEVYLNLARRMKLTGVNQLWVADITYIRLHREFVYLAVVLDAYSRKVVGWELDRTLAARLPVAALEKAITERQPPPGLVHHSDRGVQYASGIYVALLKDNLIDISMSRKKNPWDVGLDVDVTSLAVANAQKSYRCRMRQLGSGPKPFSWEALLVEWADLLEGTGQLTGKERVEGEEEFSFTTPAETQLARVALMYQRVLGTVRITGSISLRNVRLSFAE